MDSKCSHCGLELRKRYWFSFVIGNMPQTAQCDRWWCRLLSGHLLWMTTGWSLRWKQMTILLPMPTIKIPWPILRKMR